MSQTRGVWAVVPAAGAGRRMRADRPKQYLPLAGKPMLHWTLESLLACSDVAGAVVVLAASDPYWRRTAWQHAKPVLLAQGGTERQDSVLNGLLALRGRVADEDFVLVHDAARPCLRLDDLQRLLTTGQQQAVGALLARRITDTVKRADEGGIVLGSVDRDGLWAALTPQMFRYGTLRAALEQARCCQVRVTDESQAVERLGLKPVLVEARGSNLKVTLPEDIVLAECLLRQAGTCS